MPTYQYACPDCGYKFEQKQKFTDSAIRKCPHCGRTHIYRVVGQVAVSFKGSGWYITDSKSSTDKKTLEHKPKETPSANGNGNGTSESSGGIEKAESKPAEATAKTETAKVDTDKPKKA
jgi:putative FmdB family regulatory protein